MQKCSWEHQIFKVLATLHSDRTNYFRLSIVFILLKIHKKFDKIKTVTVGTWNWKTDMKKVSIFAILECRTFYILWKIWIEHQQQKSNKKHFNEKTTFQWKSKNEIKDKFIFWMLFLFVCLFVFLFVCMFYYFNFCQ